jgi:hypothetical protein
MCRAAAFGNRPGIAHAGSWLDAVTALGFAASLF